MWAARYCRRVSPGRRMLEGAARPGASEYAGGRTRDRVFGALSAGTDRRSFPGSKDRDVEHEAARTDQTRPPTQRTNNHVEFNRQPRGLTAVLT